MIVIANRASPNYIYDGSVTMEIQGTEEAIDKVIMSIESGRYVQIENMDSRTIPVDPEEYGFRTR